MYMINRSYSSSKFVLMFKLDKTLDNKSSALHITPIHILFSPMVFSFPHGPFHPSNALFSYKYHIE